MERSRTDRKRRQKCGYSHFGEPYYDVVDDQEEMCNVQILPARPLHETSEYADRDLPRCWPSQSLSSPLSSNSNSLPSSPAREARTSTAPAVNRDQKPGRRKARSDEQLTAAQTTDQKYSVRYSSSPPPYTAELMNQLSGLNLSKACVRDRQRATKKAAFNPHMKGVQAPEIVSDSYFSQRHSWDLDTQDQDERSQQSFERAPSQHQHHEWPQTKEDRHDFVAKEKPQQTYSEEDWYIGSCDRAAAEHALHLVNKDGAFLVRDCSLKTDSDPLVLVVYHEKKVYNVKIRFIESVGKYVLGTGQRTNDMFSSVADIIKFYSIFPIILISGRNMVGSKFPESCVLTFPLTKGDVAQLLQ